MNITAIPSKLPPGKVAEVRVGGEVFRVVTEEARLSVRGGPGEQPDAVVTLETEALYALVTGRKTAQSVERTSVIDGDRHFAAELLAMLYGAVSTPVSRPSRP
jgi:ubiquinone biosynthesis protein UbiJ